MAKRVEYGSQMSTAAYVRWENRSAKAAYAERWGDTSSMSSVAAAIPETQRRENASRGMKHFPVDRPMGQQ